MKAKQEVSKIDQMRQQTKKNKKQSRNSRIRSEIQVYV